MKEELIKIFEDCHFLDKAGIAKIIDMNPGNFRAYVNDTDKKVTEKTYKKIKEALEEAYNQLGKSLGKPTKED